MVPGGIASPLVQFEVPRKRLQHRSNRNGKETFDDPATVFDAQTLDGLESQIHGRIACIALCILLELQQQGRYEIECLMNVRKFF